MGGLVELPKLTWPQNVAYPISEVLNFKRFPGRIPPDPYRELPSADRTGSNPFSKILYPPIQGRFSRPVRPTSFTPLPHVLTGEFNFSYVSSLGVKTNKKISDFIITDIESTFTARLPDIPCSPPQISDITFNAILIGRVNSREEVFSELQCIDACVREHSCMAYNMEIAGSSFECTTLSVIERTEIKVGSAFRIFDRERIEKVCRLILILKILP